jgi:hypothetical protein
LNNWEEGFEKELADARSSRLNGNEGRARVCARRAAGIAAGEYLVQHGFVGIPNSAVDRLNFLRKTLYQDPTIQSLVDHLLMPVTIEHTLPSEIDLIAETIQLVRVLGIAQAKTQGDL